MGYFLDEAHRYYKAAHYAEMTALLGPAVTNISLLINPTNDALRQRSETLRTVYKMDPVLMKEVEIKYGTGEWRLPHTHAIYWGYVGLKNCKENPNNRETLIDLRRLIYQSLQQALSLSGEI